MTHKEKRLMNIVAAALAFILATGILVVGCTFQSYAEGEEGDLLYLMGNADYDKAYEVLNSINRERSKKGIATLSMDRTLMEAAMTRAAETVLYFEHARPNGSTWNSVNAKVSGENLGKGTADASKIMKLWMESSGHRENILRTQFHSVGVACFVYDGSTYWVQLYGTSGSEGADRPENGPLSVGIDLPGEDDAGGFHLDYAITSGGEPVFGDEAAEDAAEEESETLRMFEGQSLGLGLMGDGLVFDPGKVNWQSSDTEVAAVDDRGVLRITGSGDAVIAAYSGSIKRAEFSLSAKRNIRSVRMIDAFAGTEDVTERKYLEQPICPLITITDDGEMLAEGRDYTVTYRDNEGPGTGSIEIRGAGDYGGIMTKEFKIIR